MEIKTYIHEATLKPGDSLTLKWSFWDQKANRGEGGYLFNEIRLVYPTFQGGKITITYKGLTPKGARKNFTPGI